MLVFNRKIVVELIQTLETKVAILHSIMHAGELKFLNNITIYFSAVIR